MTLSPLDVKHVEEKMNHFHRTIRDQFFREDGINKIIVLEKCFQILTQFTQLMLDQNGNKTMVDKRQLKICPPLLVNVRHLHQALIQKMRKIQPKSYEDYQQLYVAKKNQAKTTSTGNISLPKQ